MRTETGGYRLEGASVSAAGRDQATFPDLPDIDVLVRDSRVLYLDPARSIAWAFESVAASMRRDGDLLKVQASAKPPREFANRIDVTVQAVIADDDVPGAGFTGDWRLSSDGPRGSRRAAAAATSVSNSSGAPTSSSAATSM